MSDIGLSGRFKSKRISWTTDELRIVLGYYFFIYDTNTRKQDYNSFADDLRKMTGNNRSNGSVGVRFGNFISVDSSKKSSGFKGGNTKCLPIWHDCINNDRTPKDEFIKLFMSFVEKYGGNKKIYEPFLIKYSSYQTCNKTDTIIEDEYYKRYNKEIIHNIKTKKLSKNKLLKEDTDTICYTSVLRRKRSSGVAAYTRIRANGICDLCGCKAPFKDKDGFPYLETHHLITLASGGPDVIYNTVALCPNCHRKMHMLDSINDKEFLKKVIYKYLLDEKESEIVEKFDKLFNEDQNVFYK